MSCEKTQRLHCGPLQPSRLQLDVPLQGFTRGSV